MAKKRVTKKELKEPDEILSFLQRCSRFVAEHRIQVAIALGAFFLVFAGIYGYVSYKNYTESKENARLWRLVSEIPEKSYSLNESDYQKLIMAKSKLEDFEKTVSTPTVALYVKYYIADINYRLGYYNAAVDKYREVLTRVGNVEELKYLCNLGLAYSLEALGKYDEANGYFEAASSLAIDSYNKGIALSGVARTFELMGKKSKAKEVYQKIVKDLPDFPQRAYIEIHLASLS